MSSSAPESPSRGFRHASVLLDGAVDTLVHDPEGVYLDGTFGRGGHSRAMLAPNGGQKKKSTPQAASASNFSRNLVSRAGGSPQAVRACTDAADC